MVWLKNVLRAVQMKRERTKQSFRLHLLAFVLASALAWYSLNPAPRPVSRTRREDDGPDELKREAEPRLRGATMLPLVPGMQGAGDKPSASPDEDDFEWPEYIDG
ncbi:MAG TPA: hypothetical protein VIW80_09090 [Pyrinomonadaceae bacterium]